MHRSVSGGRTLSPSPYSPGGAVPHRCQALLLRPRVLAALLLALVFAAAFISIGLLTAHSGADDAWTSSMPFNLMPDGGNGQQGGAYGGGDGGGSPGRQQWAKRPDVLRRPLEQRNGSDGATGSGAWLDSADASDPMAVYARCHNSKQGRKLVTDDSGALCARQHVLPNGCCRSSQLIAKRNSCGMCRTDIQCCRSYEFCVSCCLHELGEDDRAEDAVAGSAAALAGAPPRFSFHSFDRCLHLCRTSSRSIKHGNLYKTPVLKHCYTEGEHALPVKFDAESTRVIVAEQGVSCNRACQSYRGDAAPTEVTPPALGDSDLDSDFPPSELPPPATPALFICHESFLPLLNTCDTLRRHFACEGDRCEGSTGSDQPALLPPAQSGARGGVDSLVDAAGKPRGQCLINGDPKLFDCEGRHEATRRLCVCIHADKAE